ncbi:multidrug transporter subunit MdtD, partial [Desulfovibrio sp. OttesenSCG-928-A18]|nr:multidrug transporter subunit MdtD [Desulfovibrio sp. OttesenSCG-928-A18]
MENNNIQSPASVGGADAKAVASAGADAIADASRLKVVSSLVAASFFMQMLDGTILNTALPSIARSLGESPLRMQSVVIAYLITVALLIPSSGWLADRFGVRKIFCLSIALFCLGSLFCALSNSLAGLVVSRVVQGVGGAIMVPVGRLAVLRITPRKDFVRAMSFITIPGLVGPLLGPTLGGFLVQYATWHWIFLINIPVGLAGCILTLRYMPALIQARTGHFDWPGFFLFGLSMVAFSMAVEGAGELKLPRWIYLSLSGGGAVGLVTYCLYALKAKSPIFPLSLFRNRGFSAGIAGNFFARLGGGAMPFLLPLLLQLGLGYSPAMAGAAMIPLALGAMTAKPLVSPMVNRFGFRRVLVGNTILQGTMIAALYWTRAMPNPYLLLGHLTLLGMVNSFQFSVMNTVTLLELSPEQASAGNSILAVVTQLSISFGVSIGAATLSLFLGGTILHSAPGPELLPAFRLSFLVIGGWVALSSLIFSFLPRHCAEDDRR